LRRGIAAISAPAIPLHGLIEVLRNAIPLFIERSEDSCRS